MRSKDKEIRRLLCGCYEEKQGYLVSADGLRRTLLSQPLLGSNTVRYRGAYYIMREYRINGRADPVFRWIEQRIFSLGYPAVLTKRVDDACALRIPRLTNPVFYDMERQEKRLLLRIYTAAGIFARLTCRKALTLFEEDMPEQLMRGAAENEKALREAEKERLREERVLRRRKSSEAAEEAAEEAIETAEDVEETMEETMEEPAEEPAEEMPEAAEAEPFMEETEEAPAEAPRGGMAYSPEDVLNKIRGLTGGIAPRKRRKRR